VRISKALKTTFLINSTNDFEKLNSEKTIYLDRQIAFIPLEFYYSENIDIADEELTYRCFLDKEKLEKGQYSVRFYLFGQKRYHRSTQDLLIIN